MKQLFSITLLQRKIEEPLTDEEGKQEAQIWGLLTMLGSCFVDLSEKVDQIVERIDGNGRTGLIGEVLDIRTQLSLIVPIAERMKVRSTDSSSDTFKIFLRWFTDKILPSLVISVITALTVLIYLAERQLMP